MTRSRSQPTNALRRDIDVASSRCIATSEIEIHAGVARLGLEQSPIKRREAPVESLGKTREALARTRLYDRTDEQRIDQATGLRRTNQCSHRARVAARREMAVLETAASPSSITPARSDATLRAPVATSGATVRACRRSDTAGSAPCPRPSSRSWHDRSTRFADCAAAATYQLSGVAHSSSARALKGVATRNRPACGSCVRSKPPIERGIRRRSRRAPRSVRRDSGPPQRARCPSRNEDRAPCVATVHSPTMSTDADAGNSILAVRAASRSICSSDTVTNTAVA